MEGKELHPFPFPLPILKANFVSHLVWGWTPPPLSLSPPPLPPSLELFAFQTFVWPFFLPLMAAAQKEGEEKREKLAFRICKIELSSVDVSPLSRCREFVAGGTERERGEERGGFGKTLLIRLL